MIRNYEQGCKPDARHRDRWVKKQKWAGIKTDKMGAKRHAKN